MKSLKLAVWILALATGYCGAGVPSQEALKEKMICDLEVVKNTFDVKYAPMEWKFYYSGWNLEEEVNVAKAKILSSDPITVKDYQRILKEFFKSARDYHCEVHFFSTASSFLPFRIQGANRKYFVTWVDSSAKNILSVGDEVVAFDERPTDEVVQELKAREFCRPDSLTDQAFAEMFLTARLGEMGHESPHGTVRLTLKKKGSNKLAFQEVAWNNTLDGVKNDITKSLNATAALPMPKGAIEEQECTIDSLWEHPYFHKKMAVSCFEPMQKALLKTMSAEKVQERTILGSKKSFVPSLGQVIWSARSENSLYAYLFKTPDRKVVGYVRIPEYMGGTPCAEEFAKVIRLFEKESDALVIDQVNNPGGELLYMYALASMLTPSPLVLPTQRITITQQDVFNALEILSAFENVEKEDKHGIGRGVTKETISGYPVDEHLMISMIRHFNFIINEWNEGRSFTNPTHMYGIDLLNPHPQANYTKPILVLVNSLDFSCADFLPAILQDNRRATIFGAKTAGAGGILLSSSHPNRFGIANYTLTGSIAERSDNLPIENLGVTPDVEYQISEKDLQSNYSEYVNAIHRELKKLL